MNACAWCGGIGRHGGYGTEPNGLGTVLCDGCATRVERAMDARQDGGGCLAFLLGTLYGLLVGVAGTWWTLTLGLGRW